MQLEAAHTPNGPPACERPKGARLVHVAAAILLASLYALQLAPCSSSAVSDEGKKELIRETIATTTTTTNKSLKQPITQTDGGHHYQDDTGTTPLGLDKRGRAAEVADKSLKVGQTGLIVDWPLSWMGRQLSGQTGQVNERHRRKVEPAAENEEEDEKEDNGGQLVVATKTNSEKKRRKRTGRALLSSSSTSLSSISSSLVDSETRPAAIEAGAPKMEAEVEANISMRSAREQEQQQQQLEQQQQPGQEGEQYVTCAPDYDDPGMVEASGSLSPEEQQTLLNGSSGLLMLNGSASGANSVTNDEMVQQNRAPVQCVYPGMKRIEVITKVITPILFTIIIIVGLLGNIIVMIVILEDRKTERELTPTGLLILDLSLADLSFIIFCIPFTGWDYSIGHWVFGLFWCKFNQYLIVVCALSSIYTLVLMSIDRFMAIVYPIECISYRTSKNTLYAIYIKWILILIMASPTIQMHGLIDLPGTGVPAATSASVSSPSQITPFDQETTTEAFQDQTPELQYTCRFLVDQYNPLHFQIIFFITSYLFPLILIFCLYLSLLNKLWFGSKPPGHKESIKALESKKKVTWLVAGIVIVFALCWCPIQVMLILMRLRTHKITATYIAIQVFSHTLGYMNSCINPIVYAFASESFHNSFKRSSLGRFCYTCLCLNRQDHDRSSATSTNFRTIHNTTTTLNHYATATTTTTSAHQLHHHHHHHLHSSQHSNNIHHHHTYNGANTEMTENITGANNNGARTTSNDNNVNTTSSHFSQNYNGNCEPAKRKIIALPLEPRDRDNKSPISLAAMGLDNSIGKQAASQANNPIEYPQPPSSVHLHDGAQADSGSQGSPRPPAKQQLVAHVVQSSSNQVSHRCEPSYQEQELASP